MNQEEANKALFQAVEQRDNSLYFVRRAIAAGADVNAKDASKLNATPLMRGVMYGTVETAAFLLDRGADVNAKNSNRVPVLMMALSTDMVALLLERGAKVNAKDQLGYTALMQAALHGKSATVALLLERGANVNARDQLGRSALHHGALSDSPDTVALLLDRGADATMSDKFNGRTALRTALHKNPRLKTIELLKAAEEDRELNTILPRPPSEHPFEDLGKPDPQPVRPTRPRL